MMKNKIKRLVSALCASLMIWATAVCVGASDYDYYDYDYDYSYDYSSDDYSSDYLMPQKYLTDNGDILTDSEEEKISSALEDVSEKYGTDVLVYTTRDVAYNSESSCAYFANERMDEYLAENNTEDAIMFVIDMDYRLWYMCTNGEAKDAISDEYGLVLFEDKLIGYLSDGEYEECFLKYAELCDEFLAEYQDGTPYSNMHKYVTTGLILKVVGICAIIGLVIALVVTSVFKKQLNSVREQRTASNYVRKGSFKLEVSNDLFLYKNVTKTARQTSSGGGRSGGGRSGGGSRGGRGGRF